MILLSFKKLELPNIVKIININIYIILNSLIKFKKITLIKSF